MRGTIKRYISEKAFGFIATAKGDLFFHLNDVLDLKVQPERGMDVSFDIKQGKKGLQAINIKFVSGQSNSSDNIFICGNQRFKVWDIKSYGVIDCSHHFSSCITEFLNYDKFGDDYRRKCQEILLCSDIFKFLYIQTYKDTYVFAKSAKAFDHYYIPRETQYLLCAEKYFSSAWNNKIIHWSDCKSVGVPKGRISEIVYEDLDIDSVIKKLDNIIG